MRLHSASGEAVFAELTARTYDTLDGERRVVCIFRDVTVRALHATSDANPDASEATSEERRDVEALVEHALDETAALMIVHDDTGELRPIDEEKEED